MALARFGAALGIAVVFRSPGHALGMLLTASSLFLLVVAAGQPLGIWS